MTALLSLPKLLGGPKKIELTVILKVTGWRRSNLDRIGFKTKTNIMLKIIQPLKKNVCTIYSSSYSKIYVTEKHGIR